MGRLTQKIRPTNKNLEEIPNQSGVQILNVKVQALDKKTIKIKNER